MDEKDVRRSGSRSGINAASAILLIGFVLVIGVIIVFSSLEINEVTDYITAGKTTEAIQKYSSVNALGKNIFGNKVEKAFLTRYEECLSKGYIKTACEMTECMSENFDDFEIAVYSSKLSACASKALWNGDCIAAADAADFIQKKIPGCDLTVLRSGLEASIETSAAKCDFETVDYIIKHLDSPDMIRLVRGLSMASYDAVFSGGEPDFSPAVKDTLKSCKDVYLRYSLDGVDGGDIFCSFLDYYLRGCEIYGTYFEVYKLSRAVSSDIESIKENFELSLTSLDMEASRTYAATAYDFANRAYLTAQKYDTKQLGVTEYTKLCYDYAANSYMMSSWETSVDYSACQATQKQLDVSLARYENEIDENIGGYENYSDTTLNARLQAVYG